MLIFFRGIKSLQGGKKSNQLKRCGWVTRKFETNEQLAVSCLESMPKFKTMIKLIQYNLISTSGGHHGNQARAIWSWPGICHTSENILM